MKCKGFVDERTHILTILLTGGIGGGKSLAAGYLAEMGVPVYDFDSKTKELYDSDSELCHRVAESVSQWGTVLTEEGRLDRKALAGIVFGNQAALEALEAVVHPAVLADFRAWREDYADSFAKAAASGEQKMVCGCLVKEGRGVKKLMVPIVAAESAIALSKPLFDGEFDKVILITASEEVRKSRVASRDSLSEAEVTARMLAQSPFPQVCETPSAPTENPAVRSFTPTGKAETSPKIDYVIENNGEKAELVLKLINVLMDIIKEYENRFK